MSQTLDQRRAQHAWEAVKRVPKKEWNKFATQAKKLPTRIIASGLGQALAFLVAKGECPELLRSLSDWVLDKRQNPGSKAAAPAPEALLLSVVNGTGEGLRWHTAEALAYLQWLVRFTDAEGMTAEAGE